ARGVSHQLLELIDRQDRLRAGRQSAEALQPRFEERLIEPGPRAIGRAERTDHLPRGIASEPRNEPGSEQRRFAATRRAFEDRPPRALSGEQRLLELGEDVVDRLIAAEEDALVGRVEDEQTGKGISRPIPRAPRDPLLEEAAEQPRKERGERRDGEIS